MRPSLPPRHEVRSSSKINVLRCRRRVFPPALGLFAGAAHSPHLLLHGSLLCLLVTASFALESRRKDTPTYGTTETRVTTLCGASPGGPSPLFHLSSSESREDSLTAAQIWSSGSDPVQRSQPMSSTSPDPESLESHKPPCFAPILLSGPRSQNVTSSDPSLLGNISTSSSLKVTLSYPPWCLCDGGMILVQCISSGDHSFGVDERSASRPLLTTSNALMFSHNWAWPNCVMYIVSPRNCFPRPSVSEESIQFLMLFSG
ncbi:hypothetical protein Bca101_068439 [Brassica carinata]